ncbi:MAG: TolB family protein [Dehalococcoidia bacterium]
MNTTNLNKTLVFIFFATSIFMIFGCNSNSKEKIDIYPIVFSFSKEENIDIYKLANIDDEIVKLTTDKSNETNPVWSPDKNKIAYLSNKNDKPNLWVMDSNGKSKQEILESNVEVEQFYWSPDSKKIVAKTKKNDSLSIIIIDINESSQEILNLPYEKIDIGDWSPDGKWIVYTVQDNKYRGIKRKNLSGVDEFTITEENDYSPRWSPNGKWIAFFRQKNIGKYDLIYTNIDGTKSEILIENLNNKIDYDWSNDSKNIIFSKEDDESKMNEIYKVDIKNKFVEQLTYNRVNDTNPKSNNKNSKIIFSSENGNIIDLYSMLIDGSEQTRITKNSEKFLNADW